MKDRITITIGRDVYQKLKQRGVFGETYSQLILRLVESAEASGSLEHREN
jgi:predicted CopG family antitoxin